MIAIGHTSVGVILGVTAAELLPPGIQLPVEVVMVGLMGIASHYAMDLVPHGHYDYAMSSPTRQEQLRLLADFVLPITLIAIYLLFEHGFGRMSWLVGAGVLGAQLPDIVNGLRGRDILPKWGWLNKEANFHSSTHWHNPEDKTKATNEGGRRLGLSDAWQIAFVVLAILELLR